MTSTYWFWKHNSLKHIKPPRGGEFPEGWDVINFFKEYKKDYGDIVDVGCGYGRLCKSFNPKQYTGIDYSDDAVEKAKELFPEYNFIQLGPDTLPLSDTKLLYTVLLHVSDNYIIDFVQLLKGTTKNVIIAEIMGEEWRREGDPPVFNRNPDTYIQLFGEDNLVNHITKPYTAYSHVKDKDSRLHIMEFEYGTHKT